MNDVYETNAPMHFPDPKEQPVLDPEPQEEPVMKTQSVKETVERWKNDVIDRIRYLRENLDLATQEKEALLLEVDRLKCELAGSQGQVRELRAELSEVLETFNHLLTEVSSVLEG
jgi:predicted nuclease with TOPRIM domain